MPGESKLLNEAEASELLVYDLETQTHIAGSEQAFQNFSRHITNLDRHAFLCSVAGTVERHFSEFGDDNTSHHTALGIVIKVLRYGPSARRVYVSSTQEFPQIRSEEFELMDTYMHFAHVLYPPEHANAPLFN